jgi:hypothetical protein
VVVIRAALCRMAGGPAAPRATGPLGGPLGGVLRQRPMLVAVADSSPGGARFVDHGLCRYSLVFTSNQSTLIPAPEVMSAPGEVQPQTLFG